MKLRAKPEDGGMRIDVDVDADIDWRDLGTIFAVDSGTLHWLKPGSFKRPEPPEYVCEGERVEADPLLVIDSDGVMSALDFLAHRSPTRVQGKQPPEICPRCLAALGVIRDACEILQ